MATWLTWYYKNCPSVIRGWRSSQNACIQFMKKGYSLHPEHFLNDVQKEKYNSGKMRFVPGPPSVIEAPLIIGFVGKNEQTGHPSQKPEAVFDKLLLMALNDGQIVFDPMAGSGTSGASARKNGFKAILCDNNENYISMIEKRLGITRINL
ncbi:DNA methyltransferase [Megasphaera sp.]|uniref:DNA methyltransferase n=1 Tax=Megasphaera sp. TaxID=2023260 RepID=UPI00402A5E82